MKSIGILTTHPIQYYAPLFRQLAEDGDCDVTVYYGQKPTPQEQGVGFGVAFDWDVDLTAGHSHVWLKNQSRSSGLLNFNGVDTPEIADIIFKKKFDAFLVLGWYTRSHWQAMRACWKSGTPLLVRGDSHLHVQTPWVKRIAKELSHRYFIRKFSACLAVGKWAAEYFDHYGAQRVVFSPHFVDNEWFAQRASVERPRRVEIRSSWGIAPDAVVFLFAGKFEIKKRPMDLLRAFQKTLDRQKSGKKLHLLMVGDGVLKPACEDFARTNTLPVSFTGFLNQTRMPSAYAASDALVLPSDGHETWGLVVNEAMACGLPAVVSDEVGCGPDLVEEAKTGFVVRRGDEAQLSKTLEGLISDSVRMEMGRRAVQKVGAYCVEKAAEGIKEAIC